MSGRWKRGKGQSIRPQVLVSRGNHLYSRPLRFYQPPRTSALCIAALACTCYQIRALPMLSEASITDTKGATG